jgi:hypothetical protein
MLGRGTAPHRLLCNPQSPVSLTLELTYEQRPNKRIPRHYPRSRSWTNTRLAATSRQKQDSPGRPSIPWHCTPYRHTQLELCDTIVNHLPLAYKRRRRSPGHGGRRIAHTCMFSVFTTILASCLNQTSGTWRHYLLSHHACRSPLLAPRCNAIQRLEHTPAGCTAPAVNRIKLPSYNAINACSFMEIDFPC